MNEQVLGVRWHAIKRTVTLTAVLEDDSNYLTPGPSNPPRGPARQPSIVVRLAIRDGAQADGEDVTSYDIGTWRPMTGFIPCVRGPNDAAQVAPYDLPALVAEAASLWWGVFRFDEPPQAQWIAPPSPSPVDASTPPAARVTQALDIDCQHPDDAHLWRVVETCNFDNRPNERFVGPAMLRHRAEDVATAFNSSVPQNFDRYWIVKPALYTLRKTAADEGASWVNPTKSPQEKPGEVFAFPARCVRVARVAGSNCHRVELETYATDEELRTISADTTFRITRCDTPSTEAGAE